MQLNSKWFDARVLILFLTAVLPCTLSCAESAGASSVPPLMGLTRTEIETHIRADMKESRWNDVPTKYRAWAESQLDYRIEVALDRIMTTQDQGEFELAVKIAPQLVETIATIAKNQCNPFECTGRHATIPPVEIELQNQLCPGFFPFC